MTGGSPRRRHNAGGFVTGAEIRVDGESSPCRPLCCRDYGHARGATRGCGAIGPVHQNGTGVIIENARVVGPGLSTHTDVYGGAILGSLKLSDNRTSFCSGNCVPFILASR